MKYFILITFTLFSLNLQPINLSFFIVWNVGQGSMSSLITPFECVHIDHGGESYPKLLSKLCITKKNSIYLTHFDNDHVNFLTRSFQIFPKICIQISKQEMKHLKRKKNIRLCVKKESSPHINRVYKSNFKRKNQSHIYLVANTFLVTGDAPRKQEKLLKQNKLRNVKVLLLGHHGSKTSSSKELLRKLPNLRMSAVSARKRRYGHPSQLTLKRLRQKKCPVLTTEHFGHIGFIIKPAYQLQH